MKLYQKGAILIFVCAVFYCLGNIIPLSILKPDIQEVKLNTAQYLQLSISSIAAFATFLAIVIALFKEDIRKFWEFSKVNVSLPENVFFEHLNSNIGNSSDSTQALEAVKYISKVELFNSGSLTALDLEIYLESLIFKSTDYPTSQTIKTDTKNIAWNDSTEIKMNISPEGKRTFDILKLNSPSQQSSPEGGNNKEIPAKLNIAGVEINPEHKKGKWIGSFAIYSTNAKPVRFKLEVDWNGRWEKRTTEMKNHLIIKLTK